MKEPEQRRESQKANEKSHVRVRPEAKELIPARNPLLDLQQTIGNQAVVRLFESGTIQAKLRVSQPGDADELEADRVAESIVSSAPAAGHAKENVVSSTNEPAVHRKCNCVGGGASCPECEEDEVEQAKGIHRKASSLSSGDESVRADFLQSLGPGQPLETKTRAFMESRFGLDFSEVRIHTDIEAGSAAKTLNAEAFTLGDDIFFGRGTYRPSTSDPLLAHELVHVAQQRKAAAPKSTGAKSQSKQAEGLGSKRGGSLQPAGAQVQRKPDDTPPKTTETSPPKVNEPTFLERVGSTLASAGTAVWHRLKTVGETAWKGIKAVGEGIAAGAEAVWRGIRWAGSQLLDKATGVFERVMNWVARLPQRVGRLLLGLWEGVKSLKPWALEWWDSLGKADTWVGFIEWLGNRLLELAELLGVGEILETLADFVKFNTRKLTGEEIAKALSVFGASINYGLVRVDEAALSVWVIKKLLQYPQYREFTSLHTINGVGGIADYTLIHELTHVWQYQQSGAIYAFEALHAQHTAQGYDYGGLEGLRAAKSTGKGLTSFNREQQAQIVEDFYLIKTGRHPMFSSGTAEDLPLYAYFVKEVSTLGEDQLIGRQPPAKGGFALPPGYPKERLA